VDLGDSHLVELLEAVGEVLIEVNSPHSLVSVAPVVHLGDVIPGTERFASAIDDEDLDCLGASYPLNCGHQFVGKVAGECVPLLWSVQGDASGAASSRRINSSKVEGPASASVSWRG